MPGRFHTLIEQRLNGDSLNDNQLAKNSTEEGQKHRAKLIPITCSNSPIFDKRNKHIVNIVLNCVL